MSFQLTCGFELGSSTELGALSGTASIQGTTTRGSWSKYALRTNPTTTATGFGSIQPRAANGTKSAAALSLATTYCRVYFRVDTLPASGSEMFAAVALTGTGAPKFYLRVNSDGTISAYDATPTLIATGTTVLTSGTWYRFEYKVGTGNGAVVEWKINGTVDVSTTANLSATNSGVFLFGKAADVGGNSVDFYFDDIAIDNAAYPGAGRSGLLAPNANGNYQTFTIGAGAGSHYQNVNEVPNDGDTTYLLSTQTALNNETEACADSASLSITSSINGVGLMTVLKRDGVGAAAIPLLRSGTTDTTVGTGAVVAASYDSYGAFFATDPATSLAWTTSGIDGCEVGMQEASGVAKTRMSAAYLLVDWAAADATAPTASFTRTPTSGPPGTLVTVTDTSTGTPTSWDYNWGDGSTHSTTQSPTHTYTRPGTYTIAQTATNAAGSTTSTGTVVIGAFKARPTRHLRRHPSQ